MILTFSLLCEAIGIQTKPYIMSLFHSKKRYLLDEMVYIYLICLFNVYTVPNALEILSVQFFFISFNLYNIKCYLIIDIGQNTLKKLLTVAPDPKEYKHVLSKV